MDRELPPPVDMPRLSPYPGAEPAAPLRQSTRARLFGITFLVDICLNFRSAYVDASGTLVTNWRHMACHYARTWLAFDSIATFPPPLCDLGRG